MPAKDSWGGPASSEPPFVEALRKLNPDVTEAVYVYGDKEKPTPFLTRIRRVVQTAFLFRGILKKQKFRHRSSQHGFRSENDSARFVFAFCDESRNGRKFL